MQDFIRNPVWFIALYPADLRPHLGGMCHWAVVGSRSWCGGVGQRARGLWKGDSWLVWEWKVRSSKTPGLNPPSAFSCCIDITFKPCLVCCWEITGVTAGSGSTNGCIHTGLVLRKSASSLDLGVSWCLHLRMRVMRCPKANCLMWWRQESGGGGCTQVELFRSMNQLLEPGTEVLFSAGCPKGLEPFHH